MDKKLLSTAIAGALAASMSMAANADVTMFGHLDYSMLSFDEDTNVSKYTTAGGGDDINMVCTTCSIGVKGSEDLGNGLKVMFKLDFQFDGTTRNANGGITDRDQWLGLGGGWGKVRFGTISTGYKSTGAMIDPIYRTVAQGRDHGLQSGLHTGAGEEGQGRMENHVRYDSPEFAGGFKAIVDYSFDSTEADNENNDPYALTGLYNNGPILAYVSYITNDAGGSDEAWKLGGSYSMGAFKVYGQYEVDDGLISRRAAGGANLNAPNFTNEGRDVWHLGGSFSMGNNMLYAAYGQTDDDDAAGDTGSDSISLVGVHSMSKRTLIYTGWNREDFDATDKVDSLVLGMKHKF